MHAINVMLITFVPIRFSIFGKSSTVSGLLNSTAYVGCAISTYGIGYLAEKTGWFFTVLAWAVICVLALLFSLLSVKPWKKFGAWADAKEKNPEKD